MKKLFFAIYFMSAMVWTNNVWAAAHEILDPVAIEKAKSGQNRPKTIVSDPSIPTDSQGLKEYIKERAKKVAKTSQNFIDSNSGLSVIHSGEYISQQAQEGKSTFQKIYEEALSKVTLEEHFAPTDVMPTSSLKPSDAKLRSELALQNAIIKPETLGFDIIDIELPNGKKITAPAKEHIPYLASQIEIMPNGLVRIRENVTVFANGQKLKYGLSKALPKYSISRNGKRNSTIPYLNGVKINGTDIEYVLRDEGDRFLITPKKQFPLQSGIYTYSFDYMLDRKLWYYDDFNEFYWDVTGSFWNLAISKATASVRLPMNIRPMGQTLMLGFLPDELTEQGTMVTMDKKTYALGFTTLVPLLAGEGMHMLIRIPKAGFTEPDFNKKFKWFLEDYGDILFAVLGFITILGAYFISWKNIDKSISDSNKIKFQRTPALYRMLAKGVYDKISFGAFLLDIYRRGIIDIVKNDSEFKLIKQTDNLKSLTTLNRKAVAHLFPAKENILKIDENVTLKLRRASRFVEKDTFKSFKWLLLKLNSGYVFFSGLMILLAEIATVFMKVNMWQNLGVLAACTITIAFYWGIFGLKVSNKILSIAIKVFAVVSILLSLLIMTAHIHFVAALLIIAMIATVFTYSNLFAKREGLIRHNISEAKALAQNLKSNASNIILGQQFTTNQANIFALDAVNSYPKTSQIAIGYKLDLVKEIVNLM